MIMQHYAHKFLEREWCELRIILRIQNEMKLGSVMTEVMQAGENRVFIFFIALIKAEYFLLF